jgi:3-dehydro-L-gulonate 2-dehydrogenase
MGYWKGAGLSLLLDILATILSGGRSVFSLSREKVEYGLSQVFIAIDISKLNHYARIGEMLREIVLDYKKSEPAAPDQAIVYPGERALARRAEYRRDGIPVDRVVWEAVQAL